MLKNIVDGWALNTTIRYLPFRATPVMLGQMEPLRRAHNYRDRVYIAPDDLTIAIPARGQLNRQIRIAPGAYLWGATFWQFIDEGEFTYIPVPPDDMSLQLTDDATGCQFGSEFIFANSLNPAGGFQTPCLLTQPRLFVKPGLISVQLANLAATQVKCQLALYFMEPCDKILEESQCP